MSPPGLKSQFLTYTGIKLISVLKNILITPVSLFRIQSVRKFVGVDSDHT